MGLLTTPPIRPDQYRCPPSPSTGGGGGGLVSPGPWEKDKTEGGGSGMVSELCWGQLGEVGPRGMPGLREGPGPGWHFDNTTVIYLSTKTGILQRKQLGSRVGRHSSQVT